MTYKVFIDGEEGTTGLKINEYFRNRDDIELLHIDRDRRKDPEERLSFIKRADISFLCLPDAASREIAAAGLRIIAGYLIHQQLTGLRPNGYTGCLNCAESRGK